MKNQPSIELIASAALLVLVSLAFVLFVVFNVWGMDPRQAEIDPSVILPAGADLQQALQTGFYVALGMQGAILLISLLTAIGLTRCAKWGFWLGLILAVIHMLSLVPAAVNPQAKLTPAPFLQFGVGLAVFILLMLRDTRELVFAKP